MMCANIGPADYNYDETISTLRYANRAKNIKNKARINEDPKDALLRQFQKEIEELKKKLEEGEEVSGSDISGSEEDDEEGELGEDGEKRKREGVKRKFPQIRWWKCKRKLTRREKHWKPNLTWKKKKETRLELN